MERRMSPTRRAAAEVLQDRCTRQRQARSTPTPQSASPSRSPNRLLSHRPEIVVPALVGSGARVRIQRIEAVGIARPAPVDLAAIEGKPINDELRRSRRYAGRGDGNPDNASLTNGRGGNRE